MEGPSSDPLHVAVMVTVLRGFKAEGASCVFSCIVASSVYS